jgi:hypothetical protein
MAGRGWHALDDSPADLGYDPAMPTLTIAKHWYVSFAPTGRKAARTTQTFETENQAKAFALQSLARGLAPSESWRPRPLGWRDD